MSLLSDITAIVLAGGVGSRLRSVTELPKAVVPVFGRPFITYLLEALHRGGIRRAVICTGYRSELVQEAALAGNPGLDLLFSAEREAQGTGGALRLAASRVGTELVLVLNGDSYCEVDLPRFAEFHAQHSRAVSLVAAQVEDAGRYGHLSLDATDRILAFNEKTAAGPGWISAGIALVPVHLLREIPPRVPLSLEKEVFPHWLLQGMHAYPVKGPFLDIGTPDSYKQKEEFVAALQRLPASENRRAARASSSP